MLGFEAPTMSQILPPKKDVALALLERASVFVHLDPRGLGVVVPMHFKKQPRLVLQIGLNMAVPIPDLRLDDQGLSCTLSFNRSLFHCVVPWSGIFALVGEDGRGMVWPDDVPQEIAREMSPQKDDGKTDGSPAAPPPGGTGGPTGIAGGRKRPQMSLVSSPSADPKRPSKRAGGGNSKSPARKRDDSDKPTLFKVGDGDGHGKPSKPSKPTQIGRHNAPAPGKDARGRSAADDRRTEEKPSEKSKGEDHHGSAKPAAAGQPSAPTGAGPRTPGSSPPGKRSPKRELPPYLRVVK